MTTSAVAPTADASASTTPASELTAALAATALDDPARPALRAKCIEAWLPLAQHLARRYANRGEPLDDLTQVAMVGLIKSVDRYEADRGVEFSGFAIPTIVGELKRHSGTARGRSGCRAGCRSCG